MRRAWMLEVDGYGPAIVSAVSRGKAVAIGLRTLREIGSSFRFTDIRCVRIPKHDAWARNDPGDRTWSGNFLPSPNF